MVRRVFIDAVTLNHFASVDQMALLRKCCRSYGRPLWVDEVHEEIAADANPLREVVLAASSWLGDPEEPGVGDLAEIERTRVGLSSGTASPTQHLGEAQSIYFADVLGGEFITDDGPAFDLARRRLGEGRVRDTIDLLHGAVSMGDATAPEAAAIANDILNNERWFKSGRPTHFEPSYFQP